jgi:O-acetyl-ADP-ribose deacetylase
MAISDRPLEGEEAVLGGARVVLLLGDITLQDADAIVNAANSALRPGGGVDGAIQRAAGPALLAERETARRALGGSLPAGKAVATGAGRLRARRVIHAVGPVWAGGGHGEAEVLANAYRASLRVARAEELRTVAFPSISTGIYGYPVGAAAEVALAAVRQELEAHPDAFDEVRFVLFDRRTLDAFRAALVRVC